MTSYEVNFDGLVGPTHNYAGLSYGNVASDLNEGLASSPKEAALQGLMKMKALADLGLKQAVLPPHARPAFRELRGLGFTGTDADVLKTAFQHSPALLATFMSASPMWTANAATVSPSADTADGRLHLTPANLVAMPHRSIEASQTWATLKAIFADESRFVCHEPLPSHTHFGDEGAANHTRFAGSYGARGVEFFVYGKEAYAQEGLSPMKFPARQTLEASLAITRSHGLSQEKTVFAQQNPDAIDAGVFHNDVIAVGNLDTLFCHENAFANRDETLAALRNALDGELKVVEVAASDVPLQDCVSSYLFNSQLVSLPGQSGMALIAPGECQSNKVVADYLEGLCEPGSPIESVHFFDLKQSMRNGGGPACLRLRVVLTEEEIAALSATVMFSDDLYAALKRWVEKHYRDRLTSEDLCDPQLAQESYTALDELTSILSTGSIYDFQS